MLVPLLVQLITIPLRLLTIDNATIPLTPKTPALRIISRQEWLAQPSVTPLTPLEQPVDMVIISHTATDFCNDQATCTFHVRFMQSFHIESRHWSDIAYNFLVGGDGAVYEGRGWDIEGSHTKGFVKKSIGIAFIGTFNHVKPVQRQIDAAKNLIQQGVRLGKLSSNYKLFGHRQLIPSLSPGDALFDEIKSWPHFSNTSRTVD